MGQDTAAISTEGEGERALVELAGKLGAVDDTNVIRPSTDPHAAAVTALLVADYLAQPELAGKLDSVKLTAEAVHELRRLARAIIAVVTRLGGEYLPDAKGIPGDLVQRGHAVRTTVSSALEKALPDDQEVKLWLDAIRLGSGVVDLVYDLRALGELCARHGQAAQATSHTAGAVHFAGAAADAIEFALRTGDSPESNKARNTLARLWTLFQPAYDLAAAAGRELTRGEGKERQFPPLALVASHRRARRRPLSLVPNPRKSMTPSMTAPRVSGVPEKHGSAPRMVADIPSAPQLPDFDDVELYEAEEPIEILRSEPPKSGVTASSGVTERGAQSEAPAATPSAPPAATPDEPAAKARSERPSAAPKARSERPSAPASPATEGERLSWSDTRHQKRQPIEIEVGIASQSNLYLGFTENLSAGGVFVATYVAKPIGAKVEIALVFPNGDEVRVPGIVRWLRDATVDGWPGMGVQFESLSEADEKKLRKFLSLRDPLFYED